MNYSIIEIQELLTPREMEVLKLLSKGKTRNEIAQELSISLSTYDCYRKNIRAKLRIKNNVHWAKVIYGFQPE